MNRRGLIATAVALPALAWPLSADAITNEEKERNIAALRGYIVDVAGSQTPADIRLYIAEDYVSTNPSYAPGPDALASRLADGARYFDGMLSEWRYTADDLIASGETVCARGHMEGISDNGRIVKVPMLWWATVREGLIRTLWVTMDSQDLMGQVFG